MISDSKLLQLVSLIYDAADDPTRWSAFLERFAAAIGSEGTALWIDDPARGNTQVAAAVRLDPAYVAEYDNHYASTNIWLTLCNQRFSPGEVRYSQAVTSAAELRRTEWYQDYLRRQNLFYSAGLLVAPGDSSMAYLTTLRSQTKGELTELEGEVFLALLPHLKRAVQFHRHKAESNAAMHVLDAFATGVIFLGADGRVLLVNSQARLILDQSDGLTLSRNALTAAKQDETKVLRRLMQDAAQTGSGRGLGSGGALAISRPSHRRPLSVLVCPLGAHAIALGAHQPVAVVFASDPEQEPEAEPDRLARLFGLTPTEAKVAALLLQGKGPEQAAEELSMRYQTVRVHLRRLFSKTGTRRQSELVRLLLCSPAVLRL